MKWLLAIDKAKAEVIGKFDGVSEISAEQREGIVNYVQRKDILEVLPTGHGKSLLFQLLPGICLALNTMGYTSYPKKAIILVICPLNRLVSVIWRSRGRKAFPVHVFPETMPTKMRLQRLQPGDPCS